MSTQYAIPLQGSQPVTMQIALSGTTYILALYYRNVDQGGWTLDISDTSQNPIVQGIPLVTGVDLLGQYEYLGFGGSLWVVTTSNPSAVPTFENIGTDSNLYWVTDP